MLVSQVAGGVTYTTNQLGQFKPMITWRDVLLQQFGCLPADGVQAASQKRMLTSREPHWSVDPTYYLNKGAGA